jgi:hypothetical protein
VRGFQSVGGPAVHGVLRECRLDSVELFPVGADKQQRAVYQCGCLRDESFALYAEPGTDPSPAPRRRAGVVLLRQALDQQEPDPIRFGHDVIDASPREWLAEYGDSQW